jgi:hypothetical protein
MSQDRPDPPSKSATYPLSRLSASISLVDTAREIARADEVIGLAATGKLQQIAEQIRALQAQAEQVLAEARESSMLHRARCSLQKRVGHTYFLYKKTEDELYFSLLSPEEWGTPPDEFVGAFRLEPDMSWTRADRIAERDAALAPIRALLAERDVGR